jgi:hypothetical protein
MKACSRKSNHHAAGRLIKNEYQIANSALQTAEGWGRLLVMPHPSCVLAPPDGRTPCVRRRRLGIAVLHRAGATMPAMMTAVMTAVMSHHAAGRATGGGAVRVLRKRDAAHAEREHEGQDQANGLFHGFSSPLSSRCGASRRPLKVDKTDVGASGARRTPLAGHNYDAPARALSPTHPQRSAKLVPARTPLEQREIEPFRPADGAPRCGSYARTDKAATGRSRQ